MPLTLEENQIAQLWSMAEVSRLNTGGGEGVEIIKNELFKPPEYYSSEFCKYLPDYDAEDLAASSPNGQTKSKSSFKNFMKRNSSCDNFKSEPQAKGLTKHESIIYNHIPDDDEASKHADEAADDHVKHDHSNHFIKTYQRGQYTYKLYKIASKLPWFVSKILPKEALILHEKSWNMYPVIKTHLRNEYLKEKFHIKIDTVTKVCVGGKTDENVHNLSSEQLAKREIVVINIAEPVTAAEYVESEDPSKFVSQKTGRGALKDDWFKTQQPLICCYKLVDLEVAIFGIQKRCENYMVNMYARLFKKFHRQVFCWIDKWHGVTLDDVRKYELELQDSLKEQIKNGQVSANQLGDISD
jgi:hypothetical protein